MPLAKRCRARFWVSIGVMLLLSALVTRPAFAINTVVQALTPGSLTASVADLTLGAKAYSHSNQTNTGTLTLTVDDSSSTGAGWNVTIQSSDFVYTGDYGGTNIPAANFSITNAYAPTMVAGQEIDMDNGPKVPASGATGTLDSARRVVQAEANYGQGTYMQLLDVSLAIPGMSRAGDYTATLTVSVVAGPGT